MALEKKFSDLKNEGAENMLAVVKYEAGTMGSFRVDLDLFKIPTLLSSLLPYSPTVLTLKLILVGVSVIIE